MYYPISIEIFNFLSIQHCKYHFRKGKPTLIIGQNDTDLGQTRNGVGKSSLIDAISFATAGKPATRKVKQEELIRQGQPFAELRMNWLSSSGKRLRVERVLFAGSKPQDCKIWLDDERVADKLIKQTDRDGYILEEIGISEDDFFNFFMITKEKYVSFLSTSDEKKKTIINRFSGAEKIEAIKPYIELDVDREEEKVKQDDAVLNQLNGKLSIYEQQLEDEKNKQNVPARIQALEEQVAQLEEEKAQLEERNRLVREENDRLLLEIKGFNTTEVENELNILEEQRNTLISQENAFTESINQLNQKISAIERAKATEKANLAASQRSLNQELIETQNVKAKLEAQLNGFIECPKCDHQFSLSSEVDFSLEEGKAGVEEFETIIKEFEQQVIDFDNQIRQVDLSRVRESQKVREQIDEKLDEKRKVTEKSFALNKQMLTKQNELNSIKREILSREGELKINQQVVRTHIDSYNNLDAHIGVLYAEIEKLNSGEGLQGESSNLETLISDLRQQVEDRKLLRETHQKERARIEEWITNFKNFKSYLANQSIQSIQDYTNYYLKEFGSNLSVEIEGYKVSNKKIKEEINIIVKRNGIEEGSYGKFSGGEKGRIDVAVICAIQTLINLNSHEGLEFIAIDEVLESLDSTGIEAIMHSLSQIDKTVLIVTQNEVNVPKENTLLVVKTNKVTSILPQ